MKTLDEFIHPSKEHTNFIENWCPFACAQASAKHARNRCANNVHYFIILIPGMYLGYVELFNSTVQL